MKCQASLISEFQSPISHTDLVLLSNGISTCIATKPQKLLFCNEGKMFSLSDYRRSNLKKREEGEKKKGRWKDRKFGSFFYETVILQGGRIFYVYNFFFRSRRLSFCGGILEVRQEFESEEVNSVNWNVLCKKRGKKLNGYCISGRLTL